MNEDIIISKEWIKTLVKELFDNGNRGLICIKDDSLIELYLNLDAMSGFQLVKCNYDLEELKEEALKREFYVIKYEDMSNFEWMCKQTLYDFDNTCDYIDYSAIALELINECLTNEHDFKTGSDIVLYTQ